MSDKRNHKGTALNLRDVPPILKRDFKRMCAERGVPMIQAIVLFMHKEVLAHEKNVSKKK